MADAKLKILINAEDHASGTLSGIGRALSGIGGIAKGALVAGAGLAAGAIAGLGVALVDATREAMKAEEVQAQLNAVLTSTGGIAGVTADMANDLADSLSKVTRFEDEAIISGESLLLTFTNIGKDIFPETTEVMLDMSQALGQDLKSSAIQLGKALNDPIRGVTALTRVGVSFTEAQKEQIKALQDSGDLMGAQKIILAELQREFGGAARAAGQTFAGQLDILKNQLGNVKEAVGTALLPALTKLSQYLGPILIRAAERFGSWLAKIGPSARRFADGIGLISQAIRQFGFDSAMTATTFKMAFGDELGGILHTASVGVVNLAQDIGGVVSAIGEFGIKSPEAREALKDLFGPVVGNVVATVAGKITDVATGIKGIGQAITDHGLDSPETFTALSTMIGPELAGHVQNVAVNLQTLGQTITDHGLDSPETFAALSTMIGPELAGWTQETAVNFEKLGQAIVNYGLNSPETYQALQDLVGPDNVKKVQNFQSQWDWFFEQLYLGFTVDVPNAMIPFNEAMATIKLAFSDIGTAIETAKNAISGPLTDAFTGFKNFLAGLGVPNPFAGVQAAIDMIISSVGEAINRLNQLRGMGPGGGGGGSGAGGGYQMGTPWAPGGWALVGERGPELVRLPASSRVYPAEQSARMMTQPAWNVTLNITGARDPVAVGREAQAGVLRAARALGVR